MLEKSFEEVYSKLWFEQHEIRKTHEQWVVRQVIPWQKIIEWRNHDSQIADAAFSERGKPHLFPYALFSLYADDFTFVCHFDQLLTKVYGFDFLRETRGAAIDVGQISGMQLTFCDLHRGDMQVVVIMRDIANFSPVIQAFEACP